MAGRSAVALLVGMLAISTSAHSWTARVGAPGSSATAVVADARGDVFAAVELSPREASAVSVHKLSGANGRRLWRRTLHGDGHSSAGRINQMQVAANGDVIVAGALDRRRVARFFVARLAGSDGRVRWRRFVDSGPGRRNQRAAGVVLDRAGDVIAAGSLQRARSMASPMGGVDLAVVKLDGATGDERWRLVLDGGADQDDGARSVAVDAAGDALVSGYLPEPNDRPTAVLKVRGTDGSLVWLRTFDWVEPATPLAVDAAGDAVIASNSLLLGVHLVVTKLSGATGTTVWETRSSVPGEGYQLAWDLAVMPTGDAATIGSTYRGEDPPSFTIVAFDGARGDIRWQRDLRGSDGLGFGRAVVPGPTGHIVAGGVVRNHGSCYDVVTLALDEANGDLRDQHTVDGRATASRCDADCESDEPCSPPPPRAGIDRDSLFKLAVDPIGRPIAAGRIYDDVRGRGRAFVALLP